MKKIVITLFIILNYLTLQANNTLISDTLRRYGIDSHIMKTREFKKPRKCKKQKIKLKKKYKN